MGIKNNKIGKKFFLAYLEYVINNVPTRTRIRIRVCRAESQKIKTKFYRLAATLLCHLSTQIVLAKLLLRGNFELLPRLTVKRVYNILPILSRLF